MDRCWGCGQKGAYIEDDEYLEDGVVWWCSVCHRKEYEIPNVSDHVRRLRLKRLNWLQAKRTEVHHQYLATSFGTPEYWEINKEFVRWIAAYGYAAERYLMKAD